MRSLHHISQSTLSLMHDLGQQHLGRPLQEAGWTFMFDRGKRRMGHCQIRLTGRQRKIISLSRYFSECNGWELMEDVARHEIAHALDFETRGTIDHGPIWSKWAERCGADPSRLYEGDDATSAPFKYLAICPNKCGYELGFYRMIKRWYYCPSCSKLGEESRHAFLHVVEQSSGEIVRNGGLKHVPG